MRRISLVPTVALIGALFMVLQPHTTGRTVGMVSFAFRPAAVHVRPGQAVTFVNRSSTTHTATCQGCSIDSGDVQPGLQKIVTFPRAGTYRFVCRYHGARGMRMTVTVGGGSPAPSASGG